MRMPEIKVDISWDKVKELIESLNKERRDEILKTLGRQKVANTWKQTLSEIRAKFTQSPLTQEEIREEVEKVRGEILTQS
jgi:hypothetical protein